MTKNTALDLASLTSLILTCLWQSDIRSAREIAAETGLTVAQLRPALRLLVESGAVVTSGRTSATRYLLAVEEEQPAPVQPVKLVVSAADDAQEAPRPARKPRAARSIIPATVDLEGALQATQQRLEAGATLRELSARAAA